ncbi:DUF2842 domain-containing protein [Sphingomonas koreensis]|uniref:DUF2842 domain-containing protein n=1 Tax=Sphingomonas koreensis TaxID=93064 RepID=UPI00083305E0|nr:DUF2842 domain-containing protein [Sphingomonas koreensis]PJI87497.1 uncharacterized protein DUF2842 [Sphingomonas koreensis]
MTPHTPSWRKPVGAFAIVALILVWCVGVASLSASVGQWPVLVQLVFYVFTGIVWILPLKPLLRWMETGRWRLPKAD